MRKTKAVITLSALAVCLVLAGCGGEEKKEDKVLETFSTNSSCEEFQDIPLMSTQEGELGTAEDYGGGTWILDVEGSTLEEYQSYLTVLEENGFGKYADNGSEGLDGSVYTATFTRDGLALTVTHLVKLDRTYLAANPDQPLSEHLVYREDYVADSLAGAKTTLHLMELYDNGNSIVIQLKNGHFLISDGGNPEDLPYLLDYLEALAPEGEKPVIEAWTFSHAHIDHVGAFLAIADQPQVAERFFLEGVYFNEPGMELLQAKGAAGLAGDIETMSVVAGLLQTTAGEVPQVYRIQTGQRYYFSDVTMEVVLTQEQMLAEQLSGDYNDTSTWLMFNIEEQKALVCGDADRGSVAIVMDIYNSGYFDLDVYTVFHHGINMFYYFWDWCTSIRTALYTCYRCGSLYPDTSVHAYTSEQQYLMGMVQEAMSYGKGTKVLTFPYEVGTATTCTPVEWKYEPGGVRIFDGAWGERYEVFEDYIINP